MLCDISYYIPYYMISYEMWSFYRQATVERCAMEICEARAETTYSCSGHSAPLASVGTTLTYIQHIHDIVLYNIIKNPSYHIHILNILIHLFPFLHILFGSPAEARNEVLTQLLEAFGLTHTVGGVADLRARRSLSKERNRSEYE